MFLAYWAWNGTISLSKTVAGGHPDLELHAGNVWFSLFLFFVFFPHEVWAGSKRFVGALRRNAWLFLLPLAIIALAKLKGSRSEEHTSELQSLMRISYAVFCLKKKKNNQN